MLGPSEALYLSAKFQLLLTVCLVTLLWAFHARLQRFGFFQWWAWAWTASAVFLAAATYSLYLGVAWTPQKAAATFVVILSGLFSPLLLVYGGMNWLDLEKPSWRTFWWGIAIVSGCVLACFAGSIAFRSIPIIGFSIRNIPRTVGLAVALIFCCTVFWRHFRKNGSYAAAITGLFCFSYAVDQLLYFLSFAQRLTAEGNVYFPGVLGRIANLEPSLQSTLLFMDLVDTCGICGGMILLLVERYRDAITRLELSERKRFDLALDKAALQMEMMSRQRATEDLRRSEEFSRRIVLNSPVAMVVARGENETVVVLNEKFTSLFGYTADEVHEVSEWWPRAYPDPEYRAEVQAQWQRLIEEAKSGTAEKLSMEARVSCKDGSFRDIEFHLSTANDLYLVSFVDLTDRKKATEALQESESRYRDLVEHSEDFLGTHELEGRILTINQAPCRKLGYSVQEMLQMNMQDLLAPRFRHLFPEFVKRVLENGQDSGVMVVVTSTGEERYWEYISTLRREGVPTPVIRGMAHDVTDRLRAERALKLSESKFATAFRASPHAMIIVSLRDGRFIDVNASFERQTGYTRDELLGKTFLDVGMWADSADFARMLAEALKRKKISEREVRLRTKSGRVIHALYSAEVIEIDGEPCALSAGEDITERLKIEHALRESEAKFRLVVDTVNAAIWIYQDGRLVYFNEEFQRISGYSRDELFSMNPFDLIHPDYRAENMTNANARLRGEEAPSRYQFAIITKSGEVRWLDFSAALTAFNGMPAVLGSALDITATKRAERELREHAMYMDAMVSNIPLGVVTKDQQQLVRFCNAAFEQMFQYTQAEIQGRNLDDIIAPHDHEEAALLSAAVQQGGVVHTTARRRRKDGTFIDVELYGIKVCSEDSFIGAFAIYQDITERRKSEEKLVSLRSRLARAQEDERARIARDLHDDAGQRLALLSIDLEQLKQTSMRLKSSLTQQLESLVKAASEITSDVHNVSRRLHPSQVELLGLTTALANFCRDFGARNSMEIEFVHENLPDKPSQNAALCLFRVAQEAIRNVQKHSGIRKALVQLDEVSGSLRLRVSDQGVGFDPESADFSQGLGLLSMEERLRSLGGELFVHSRPGGGTCIEACIPLSTAVPA